MSSAALPAYQSRGSVRQRVISGALALAVAALVILGLILAGLVPQVFVPVGSGALSTFNVTQGGREPAPNPQPRPQVKAAAKQTPRPATRVLPKPVVEVPNVPPTGMIVLSRDDFAAADIGKIKGSADSGDAGAGEQTADSKAAYGPGAGPGGKTLYAAEWVREPTRAEMEFYFPHGMVEGWGMIACQTVERNRVDNCRQLGESPGSGISRGMRQAAWQFLVRPPRVNGKPLIGAWVSIRYDIVRGVTR